MIVLYKNILSSEKDIVALRNKLRNALIVLTNDHMFSAQQTTVLSDILKRVFTGFNEILCSISLGTNNATENHLLIELFNIESAGDTKEKDITIIEKLSFIRSFELDQIESAKNIFNVKNVSELLVDIQSKNVELENSLHNLRIAKDQNARMESELEVGQSIQMSMLPKEEYKSESIDLYAKLIPAREVGGDFYDFHFLDEKHLCFVMADVSGKGVPAALMMAVTKTLLKSEASNDKSPASILTHVNNEIAKDNDSYMFITVFLAILNTNSGELVYSNAGHNPSYIISREKKELIKLGDLHGPVIGAMEGMTYGETKHFLKKNDIIFSYTDGVTESQNIKEELYSDPRLEELLQNGNYNSTEALINLVINSVKEFEGDADQFDDITAMAIKFCQNPNIDSSIISSIKIINDFKQITNTVEWFEAFAMENNMPFSIVQKINIAFDELLNNIISYGYKDQDVHEIDIEIELRGERLIIIICDDGIPFNPFKKDPPDTMLNIEERMIGGLGIHLVKNLMDECKYERQTNKNIITLIKHNINI